MDEPRALIALYGIRSLSAIGENPGSVGGAIAALDAAHQGEPCLAQGANY
jgi:hypothetical protein